MFSATSYLGPNLVETMVGGGFTGNCGARGWTDGVPIGIDAWVSITPLDYQETTPYLDTCYGISHQAFDVGAGNWLNVSLITIINPNKPILACHYFPYRKDVPNAQSIKEGPKVLPMSSSSMMIYLEDGETIWTIEGPKKNPNNMYRAEILKWWEKLEPCTLLFTSSPNYHDKFQKHILDELGWREHLLWQSPKFANRAHPERTDNSLIAYLIQKKA